MDKRKTTRQQGISPRCQMAEKKLQESRLASPAAVDKLFDGAYARTDYTAIICTYGLDHNTVLAVPNICIIYNADSRIHVAPIGGIWGADHTQCKGKDFRKNFNECKY